MTRNVTTSLRTTLTRIASVAGIAAVFGIVAATATAPTRADTLRWKAEGWQTDFDTASVDLDRILSGGPPRDGIPSIDNPVFEFVPGHDDLAPTDPVVGVTIGGDARAYPLRILTWHEIVNDVVGDTPIAVTYCPLCNSAPVFERTVDGRVLEFGVSGKLKDSNLIMYDRQTETWWQQFTGEAIVGELTGTLLELVPARLQSWAEFAEQNPNGRVLVPSNARMRDYGRNPYVSYDTSLPFLYDGQLPEDINPMERVVIVPRKGADPFLITMNAIAEEGQIERDGLTLSWNAGQASALDSARIAQGRDVGTVLVQRQGADVPYDVTFAFVAHAFHPGVAIARD
ncbi:MULTISPECIES: DUF3179 domain-containing protein [unclassified Roseitalea]|uniref:DUF3179 domain-containing protein n=1 Tax=unclassified Roseitalea TaxID=2639107 RepID=UPI00273FF2F0|nr:MULTISPECIES: DUF3179 domain-containing protein [unclassified Roseitalea]